jgi:hypothetical protein
MVGLGLGLAVVGLGLPVDTLPVHVVPLRLNNVGAGLAVVYEPLKPSES